MGILVTEVDFEGELEAILQLFETGFQMQSSPERFRWLYGENPDGRAITWLVSDEQSGAKVGCTAVFPRRVRIAGEKKPIIAWNCGDFAILKKYRTLGAAVKLRRAARDAVDAGKVGFLYAHPNDRMLAVHLRAGHGVIGRMVRYARPLRLTNRGAIVRQLSGAALRLWRWPHRPRRLSLDLVASDRLPADIDCVDETTAGRNTALVRDRAYLDWRFGRNPLERSEVLIAREGGRPAGFLVFAMKQNVGIVKDWLAVTDAARDELFSALVGELWRRGASSVSVIALETHPDLLPLSRMGFLRRPESSAVITYVAAAHPARDRLTNPARWYMTVGDRDV